jgi:hypothetical protein
MKAHAVAAFLSQQGGWVYAVVVQLLLTGKTAVGAMVDG